MREHVKARLNTTRMHKCITYAVHGHGSSPGFGPSLHGTQTHYYMRLRACMHACIQSTIAVMHSPLCQDILQRDQTTCS